MKDNIVEYKGYYTKIEYSAEDRVLHGKIEGINDLVNFESSSVDEIINEFHLAVDDYLEYCAELGKEPDKMYSGSFNIRISPDLHKTIAMKANKEDMSLNKAVEQAITNYVYNDSHLSEEREIMANPIFSSGVAISAMTAISGKKNSAVWVGGVSHA